MNSQPHWKAKEEINRRTIGAAGEGVCNEGTNDTPNREREFLCLRHVTLAFTVYVFLVAILVPFLAFLAFPQAAYFISIRIHRLDPPAICSVPG